MIVHDGGILTGQVRERTAEWDRTGHQKQTTFWVRVEVKNGS